MDQIGNIDVLTTRVYNLHPECHCPNATSVVVTPGTYPLYSDGLTTFFLLTGRINLRGLRRMGDGMFGMHANDQPSDTEVTFPSRCYGQSEWADLIESTLFADGHPDQRLRLRELTEA